jgi:two-component system, OmpR family, sensor histidine kinase CssS
MKRFEKMKLSTQINLIFTVVTLLTSFIFLFAVSQVIKESRIQQNKDQLNAYFNEVIQMSPLSRPPSSRYNGYVVYQNGRLLYSSNLDVLDNQYTTNRLYAMFSVRPGFEAEDVEEGNTYYFRFQRRSENDFTIVFTGDDYLSVTNTRFSAIALISLIAIILLGNITILLWSRITVDRVKRLQDEVSQLNKNNYHVPIKLEGGDEITDLARTIEKMRREIESSENIKQEMLQNISHDFKTPIAVIKSYAEAISDGISNPKEAEIIIKQSDVLNQKVKQLLELNKLEYLKNPSHFENVKIKSLIKNIVNQQKYRTNIQIKMELDDSTYFATKENLMTVFSNILDNALRYAKKEIKITLKQKKLTFYNDGESISDKFIEQLFKPYEKGDKGQFGLGMSIVQKTCEHFNLTLSVKNVNPGVEFVIEPL